MNDIINHGVAFILEGDTEKEFYLSLLEFLCQKYSATLEREVDCGTDPDISYLLKTQSKTFLIKFEVVNTITQMPQSGRWFISRCFERHRNIEWTVFLCYDTDDYKNDISKFHEGDWVVLRDSLQKKAHSVVDIAAAADIEDVLLQDISGISTYLGSEVILQIPAGRKGKVKMKNLYRKMGKTYHEGRRSRAMIDALDMQLIIDSNIVPLCEIETLLFK